ncbi:MULTISPECIES: hypothetical protein [unclassified Frankia]|uniref:hypothetical protein n=1 Tax=unclassified Frankia TaxID=2632575 RepID=UPI002AD44A47|nr:MULTISPECIES: hypothetical protein [unclassified Frankia]
MTGSLPAGRHTHACALLVACLDDIDQQPSPDVVAVFRALQQPDPRDVRSA